MKKLVLAAAILAISFSAMAQLLPVLGTVGTTKAGDASLIAATAIHAGSSGVGAYGIRGTYCPLEDFLLIGDVVLTRTEFGDKAVHAPGLGVSAQFSFSKVESLLVDIALRVGYCVYETRLPVNSSNINAMLLISGESDTVKGLAAYGGLGAAYWQEQGLNMSALLNIGLRYTIPQANQFSIDGEVTYVSGNVDMQAGLGCGIAYAF